MMPLVLGLGAPELLIILTICLLVNIVLAVAAGLIARRKGRSLVLFALLTLVGGVIVLIIIAVLPSRTISIEPGMIVRLTSNVTTDDGVSLSRGAAGRVEELDVVNGQILARVSGATDGDSWLAATSLTRA
jgi:hypothetical protein